MTRRVAANQRYLTSVSMPTTQSSWNWNVSVGVKFRGPTSRRCGENKYGILCKLSWRSNGWNNSRCIRETVMGLQGWMLREMNKMNRVVKMATWMCRAFNLRMVCLNLRLLQTTKGARTRSSSRVLW